MCTDEPNGDQSPLASRKRTRRTHLHVFTLLVVLNYCPNCATLLEHSNLSRGLYRIFGTPHTPHRTPNFRPITGLNVSVGVVYVSTSLPKPKKLYLYTTP
jgi:ribosomal protein L32